MLNQEELYTAIFREDWAILINILYKNRSDIPSDPLLARAATTFEDVFLKKVEGIPTENLDVIPWLENLYILHTGKFYFLTPENYKRLVLELIKRKPQKETYNFATLFPDEEVAKKVIEKNSKTELPMDSATPSEHSMHWIQVYNRIFELINHQNDVATYFSGSRFINTIREFDSYFPDYSQYIELRNQQGKSTTRKIYYYDILVSLNSEIRDRAIDRILDIVRPFNADKVQEIELQLGKQVDIIRLDFSDTIGSVTETPTGSPVVFISYSWDSEDHKEWVLKLANKLVVDGVDVILDRYELHAGKSLPQFVENSIGRAHKILVVFTPNYKLKADKRTGGVGYEYSIMNVDLYKSQTTNEKIIPMLRDGTISESIPTFMQQFIHLNISDDVNFENSYNDLLREIYNEPSIVKPKRGEKPRFELRGKI